MKKKLLWVGDAAVPTGFARATHEILDVLRHVYDVTVLGINYRGDPHLYPYEIWAASPGGDQFGVKRLIWMCDRVKPDVIVLQNDPWNIPVYLDVLEQFDEYKNVPVVGIIAIDGKNINGKSLNRLSLAIFWTQFGLAEAREGGYTQPAAVIPLGVDTNMFYPVDKRDIRNQQLPSLVDKFIVGNVNRNQPRKRFDLTIKYFAKWITEHKITDAYLYLHIAPTGDTGVNVMNLMKYYGVIDRLALVSPDTWYGIEDEGMRDTYNCFDVSVSTTQGEGFGLTALEAAACGVNLLLPDWSALGEVFKDAAWLIPCTSTAIGPPYVNVIGGIADEKQFISALNSLYRNAQYRETNNAAALERARENRFRWSNIGDQYVNYLNHMFRVMEERAKIGAIA